MTTPTPAPVPQQPVAPQQPAALGGTSPWKAITPDDEYGAVAKIRSMLVGTKMLAKQPGVVYALQQQNAGVPDAQSIDQFMQAMDLEKQVRLHLANNSKMLLDSNSRQMLDQLGVDYSKVQFSQQDATNSLVNQIESTGGTVQRNPDGSLKLDKNNNVVVTQHVSGGGVSANVPVASVSANLNESTGDVTAQTSAPDLAGGSTYKAKGIGRLFHTLNNDILKPAERDVLHPALNALSKPLNLVQSSLVNATESNYSSSATSLLQKAQSQSQDMTALGYNPGSVWSALAYQSSGKAHTDLTPLNNQYGPEAVSDAVKYLGDPKGYRQEIENNPASYTLNAQGKKALTPTAAAALQKLTSPEFTDLLKRVQAQDATIGNTVLNAVGLDPVKHSTAYNVAAAGVNLAAAFMIDPLIVAGSTVRGIKISQVGLDSAADSNGAAAVLSGAVKGGYAAATRDRWQAAIEQAQKIRQAADAGDEAAQAHLTAQFVGQYRDLEPILSDMTGVRRYAGVREVKPGVTEPIFESGPAWRDVNDAADWMASKSGMVRLMNGRAAWNAPFMPGAVSNFGFNYLRGKTAGWMTARSQQRAAEAYDAAEMSLDANPALQAEWESKGLLSRVMATPVDAVDAHTGEPIAGHFVTDGTVGMPSEERARLALTPAGKGEVVRNLRATGSPVGDSRIGWGSPTAIAARTRLAAQRLSTMLPRNTLINLNDENSSEKVRKIALTYLNRGDANMIAAAWNTADEGGRKAILGGLVDQLAHASGMTQTETGRRLVDSAKTPIQSYSSVGDDVIKDGQALALYEGQVRQTWMLPTFRDMQSAAQKLGLWEATMGRALTSHEADLLMSQWKMNALFKPSTVTRNQLEGWLRTALEGKAGEAVRAKAIATMPNKELWARGLETDALDTYRAERGKADTLRSMLAQGGLSREQRANGLEQIREAERQMALVADKPIVQHALAKEAGDEALAKQIANGSMMGGQALGRSRIGTKTAAFLGPIGRAYRTLYGRDMDSARVKAMLDYGAGRTAMSMHNYGQQINESDLGLRNAARQATDIGQAGFGPSSLKFAMTRGWDKSTLRAKETAHTGRWAQQDLEGIKGADRYANALGMRVNATPGVTNAVLDHLEGVEGASLDKVVEALDAAKRHTAFGTVFWDDGAIEARKAMTDAEVALGKREWAQRVVDDHAHLLVGQNGRYQQEIADYIREEGKAPDADWIANKLTGDNRPESALAPEVIATPNGEGSIIQRIQDVEGEAYQWAVERVLQRTTTGPVFLANYAETRVGLQPTVEKLVEQGISREAANNMARDLAERNAMIRTEQLVDDPGQKTQFDVIARNIFPFSRATQAMIRRWGSGLWADPTRARKLMLAYEGAVHSGFVYQNAYGEPTFTYPASGVLNMAMRQLAKVPGFESFAYFPVSSSMTGGVLMSVPGADNPFRMSMGPMAAIPMREVFKHVFPASMRGSLDQFDAFINGPIGVGETWSQLVPTAVRKIYAGFSTDERNSALASSMVGAIANLAAAGQLPPPDAPESVRQEFLNRLRTQVRNQLVLRAIFGLVAPAAPSTPTEGTSASQADYAFHVEGVGQLSDEYKAVLNDVNGDVGKANVIWNTIHPDKFVYNPDGTVQTAEMAGTAYETGHSRNAATKTALAPTEQALNWMAVHEGFIKKYGSVSAYFLPEAGANAPFSEQAYKTQLELGLRQRKTPGEFMDDLQVRHAEAIYYPAVKDFDAKIAAARALGDTYSEQQLTQAKSAWETEFKALNPLLQRKMDSYPAGRNVALNQLADLKQMVAKGEVPEGQGPLLDKLIKNYEGLDGFVHANKGADNAATEARRQAYAAFAGWVQQNIADSPLADLYSGVFRTLNTNLVNIAPSGG